MSSVGRVLSPRRLLLPAVICALVAAPLAPGAAAAQATNEPTIHALVLQHAKSPVLEELGKVADLKETSRSDARTLDPHAYDLLIVDSDALSFRELDTKNLISRFRDAGRWVMVLDATGHDQNAIEDQTGVGVSQSRSEMFLFGISRADGPPQMAMVDSGNLTPYGADRAGDNLVDRARQDAARRAARSAARAIEQDKRAKAASAPGIAARAPVSSSCVPASFLCAESAQVDRYEYTQPSESAVMPDGYWNGQQGFAALSKSPKGHHGQVASWKQNLWFDVALENSGNPIGDHQVIFYESNLNFTPAADNTKFWQMDDPFRFALDPEDHFLERAWWTGIVNVDVKPDQYTDGLAPYPTPGTPAVPASSPQTSNGETQYSVGDSFSVGINAAKPDGGGGVNASYTYSNSRTYSQKDWSFVNRSGAGDQYSWEFYAANPCDVRSDSTKDGCFSGIHYQVEKPKPSSTSNIDVPTWGRWKACYRDAVRCPMPALGSVGFYFATPVTMIDSYLEPYRYGARGQLRREKFGRTVELPGHRKPPTAVHVQLDPSRVLPCPDETYVDGDNCKPLEKIELLHANGSKVTQSDPARVADAGTTCENEVITGRVTLGKKVDRADRGTKVILWSDGANAKLVDGSPVSGNPGETTRSLLVPNGQRTADFQIRTNANGLTDKKPSTEATITAFFVQPANQGGQLPIRRKPSSDCPPS